MLGIENIIMEQGDKLQPMLTIITEQENYYDYWNRQLGYVILPGGECLNDLLLINGYANVTQQYYCGKHTEIN